MKKLGKLSINPEKVLENEKLVTLKGGYVGEGFFKCTCTSGVNPPYQSPWCEHYETTQEMLNDINKICVNGVGSCNAGCF